MGDRDENEIPAPPPLRLGSGSLPPLSPPESYIDDQGAIDRAAPRQRASRELSELSRNRRDWGEEQYREGLYPIAMSQRPDLYEQEAIPTPEEAEESSAARLVKHIGTVQVFDNPRLAMWGSFFNWTARQGWGQDDPQPSDGSIAGELSQPGLLIHRLRTDPMGLANQVAWNLGDEIAGMAMKAVMPSTAASLDYIPDVVKDAAGETSARMAGLALGSFIDFTHAIDAFYVPKQVFRNYKTILSNAYDAAMHGDPGDLFAAFATPPLETFELPRMPWEGIADIYGDTTIPELASRYSMHGEIGVNLYNAAMSGELWQKGFENHNPHYYRDVHGALAPSIIPWVDFYTKEGRERQIASLKAGDGLDWQWTVPLMPRSWFTPAEGEAQQRWQIPRIEDRQDEGLAWNLMGVDIIDSALPKELAAELAELYPEGSGQRKFYENMQTNFGRHAYGISLEMALDPLWLLGPAKGAQAVRVGSNAYHVSSELASAARIASSHVPQHTTQTFLRSFIKMKVGTKAERTEAVRMWDDAIAVMRSNSDHYAEESDEFYRIAARLAEGEETLARAHLRTSLVNESAIHAKTLERASQMGVNAGRLDAAVPWETRAQSLVRASKKEIENINRQIDEVVSMPVDELTRQLNQAGLVFARRSSRLQQGLNTMGRARDAVLSGSAQVNRKHGLVSWHIPFTKSTYNAIPDWIIPHASLVKISSKLPSLGYSTKAIKAKQADNIPLTVGENLYYAVSGAVDFPMGHLERVTGEFWDILSSLFGTRMHMPMVTRLKYAAETKFLQEAGRMGPNILGQLAKSHKSMPLVRLRAVPEEIWHNYTEAYGKFARRIRVLDAELFQHAKSLQKTAEVVLENRRRMAKSKVQGADPEWADKAYDTQHVLNEAANAIETTLSVNSRIRPVGSPDLEPLFDEVAKLAEFIAKEFKVELMEVQQALVQIARHGKGNPRQWQQATAELQEAIAQSSNAQRSMRDHLVNERAALTLDLNERLALFDKNTRADSAAFKTELKWANKVVDGYAAELKRAKAAGESERSIRDAQRLLDKATKARDKIQMRLDRHAKSRSAARKKLISDAPEGVSSSTAIRKELSAAQKDLNAAQAALDKAKTPKQAVPSERPTDVRDKMANNHSLIPRAFNDPNNPLVIDGQKSPFGYDWSAHPAYRDEALKSDIHHARTKKKKRGKVVPFPTRVHAGPSPIKPEKQPADVVSLESILKPNRKVESEASFHERLKLIRDMNHAERVAAGSAKVLDPKLKKTLQAAENKLLAQETQRDWLLLRLARIYSDEYHMRGLHHHVESKLAEIAKAVGPRVWAAVDDPKEPFELMRTGVHSLTLATSKSKTPNNQWLKHIEDVAVSPYFRDIDPDVSVGTGRLALVGSEAMNSLFQMKLYEIVSIWKQRQKEVLQAYQKVLLDGHFIAEFSKLGAHQDLLMKGNPSGRNFGWVSYRAVAEKVAAAGSADDIKKLEGALSAAQEAFNVRRTAAGALAKRDDIDSSSIEELLELAGAAKSRAQGDIRLGIAALSDQIKDAEKNVRSVQKIVEEATPRIPELKIDAKTVKPERVVEEWELELWRRFNELTLPVTEGGKRGFVIGPDGVSSPVRDWHEQDIMLAAFSVLRNWDKIPNKTSISPQVYENMVKAWGESNLMGQRLGEVPADMLPVVEELAKIIKSYEGSLKGIGAQWLADPVQRMKQHGVIGYVPHIPSSEKERASQTASGLLRQSLKAEDILDVRLSVSKRRVIAGTIAEINSLKKNLGLAYNLDMQGMIARYLQVNREIGAKEFFVTMLEGGVIRYMKPANTEELVKMMVQEDMVPLIDRASSGLDHSTVDIILTGDAARWEKAGIDQAAIDRFIEAFKGPRGRKRGLSARSPDAWARWAEDVPMIRQAANIQEAIARLRRQDMFGRTGNAIPTDLKAAFTHVYESPYVPPNATPREIEKAAEAALKTAWDKVAANVNTRLDGMGHTKIRVTGKSLERYFRQGEEFYRLYIPRAVAESLNELLDPGRANRLAALLGPKTEALVGKGVNTYLLVENFIKASFTILALGFTGRNAVANTIVNLIDLGPGGALSPTTNATAALLAAMAPVVERYGSVERALRFLKSEEYLNTLPSWQTASLFTDTGKQVEMAGSPGHLHHAWLKGWVDTASAMTGRDVLTEGIDLGDGVIRTLDDSIKILTEEGVLTRHMGQYMNVNHTFEQLQELRRLDPANVSGIMSKAKGIASRAGRLAENALFVAAPMLVTGVPIPISLGRRFGKVIARTTENQARVTNFIGNLKRSGDWEQARSNVNKFLFDYDDLTGAQRRFIRHVMPFFIWRQKNLVLHAKLAFEKPIYFAVLNRFLNHGAPILSEAMEADRENRPFFYPRMDVDTLRGIRQHALPHFRVKVPHTEGVYFERLGTNLEAGVEDIGKIADFFLALKATTESALPAWGVGPETKRRAQVFARTDRGAGYRLASEASFIMKAVGQAWAGRHFYYDIPIEELNNTKQIGAWIKSSEALGPPGRGFGALIRDLTDYHVVYDSGTDRTRALSSSIFWISQLPWSRVLSESAAVYDLNNTSLAANPEAMGDLFDGDHSEMLTTMKYLRSLYGLKVIIDSPEYTTYFNQKQISDGYEEWMMDFDVLRKSERSYVAP